MLILIFSTVISAISFATNKFGDLQSTIAAIIFDREARSVVLDFDSAQGSLREPLLKLIAFMRAMNYQVIDRYQSSRYFFTLNDMSTKIGQMAFEIQSVFSFFRPEYSPNGPIQEASLVSPEALQYVTPTIIGFLNGLFSMIKYGLSDCFNGFGVRMKGCGQVDEGELDNAWGKLSLSYNDASDSENIVHDLATLLTAGRLNDDSRQMITQELENAPDVETGVRLAQQLIAVSPEFHSTNMMEFNGEDREVPPPISPSTIPYKAVVYFLASGGIDSYNMIVPHSGCVGKDMYQEYSTVRSSVALEKNDLLQIGTGGIAQVCTTFGIHPDLPILKELYSNTDLVSILRV